MKHGKEHKVIEIVVSPMGETVLQTKGFTGGDCRDATRSLEEALGVRSSEKLTGEFYRSTHQREKCRQHQ